MITDSCDGCIAGDAVRTVGGDKGGSAGNVEPGNEECMGRSLRPACCSYQAGDEAPSLI